MRSQRAEQMVVSTTALPPVAPRSPYKKKKKKGQLTNLKKILGIFLQTSVFQGQLTNLQNSLEYFYKLVYFAIFWGIHLNVLHIGGMKFAK